MVVFIVKRHLKNAVYKMAAILSRPQCVHMSPPFPDHEDDEFVDNNLKSTLLKNIEILRNFPLNVIFEWNDSLYDS